MHHDDDLVDKITDLAMKERDKSFRQKFNTDPHVNLAMQREFPETALLNEVPFGPDYPRTREYENRIFRKKYDSMHEDEVINPHYSTGPKGEPIPLVKTVKRKNLTPSEEKELEKILARRSKLINLDFENNKENQAHSFNIADSFMLSDEPTKNKFINETEKGTKVYPPKPTKFDRIRIIKAHDGFYGEVFGPTLFLTGEENEHEIVNIEPEQNNEWNIIDMFSPTGHRTGLTPIFDSNDGFSILDSVFGPEPSQKKGKSNQGFDLLSMWGF